MRALILATALTLAAFPAALAQNASTQGDGTTAQDGSAAQDGTAPATQTAPPPEYNGSITGSASGSSINTQVVCTGFGEGGGVTVQSDPGGNQQDTNGDGVMADISADPSGGIALTLLVGNNQVGLTDSSAVLTDTSLTYSITMTFVGGGEEKVDITVTCN